jgi:hypothetical protein
MRHLVKIGMNYKPKGSNVEVRREPGDIVDDVPSKSVKWLIQRGAIEIVDDVPPNIGDE